MLAITAILSDQYQTINHSVENILQAIYGKQLPSEALMGTQGGKKGEGGGGGGLGVGRGEGGGLSTEGLRGAS